MTTPTARATRLVCVGNVYKVVSATLKDFDKMIQTGNVKMIAQWDVRTRAWVYFDDQSPPPFRFEELA